jgi:hypothetical protein
MDDTLPIVIIRLRSMWLCIKSLGSVDLVDKSCRVLSGLLTNPHHLDYCCHSTF